MTIRESRNTTPSKMRQSPILVFYDNQSEGVFHTHTHIRRDNMNIIIIIIINPSTARVVGAPQMTLLPVFSIFPCSPLSSGTCRARPVHSLKLSSHLFLCLRCLLPPFTVPCKMVLARPDELASVAIVNYD